MVDSAFDMDIADLGLLAVGAVSPALPPFFVKRAILDRPSNQWIWMFASILCYLVLIYVYWIIFSEKKINVMMVYFIIKIASIMVALAIGTIWFGYSLNWESILGLIFGIVSIALLSKNSGH